MGVALSATAAFFSVYGLAQLFAGAFVAVIILGGLLEIAKLVLAAGLHQHWTRIPRWMKVTFSTQLVVLMLITAMGIFGYLTNGYLAQKQAAVPITNEIRTIDSSIKSEQARITQLEGERADLNKTLEIASSAGATAAAAVAKETKRRVATSTIVTEAVKGRQSLNAEFTRVADEIRASQTRIEDLERKKSKLQGEVTNTESKIGPLKFVAALLFGSEETASTDAAVRALILMMMFVFDPLAVTLVIFGTSLIMRSRMGQVRVRQMTNSGGGMQAKAPALARTVVKSPNVTSFADLKQKRDQEQSAPPRVGASMLRRPAMAAAA